MAPFGNGAAIPTVHWGWAITQKSCRRCICCLRRGTDSPASKVRGRGFWPFHQVLLNGKELETQFVSRNELDAVLPADAIPDAGMYKVTVKSRGEPIAESNPAPLVVRFKQ